MRTRAGMAAVDIIRAQNVKSLAPNSKPSIPNATVLIGWLRQTRGHAAVAAASTAASRVKQRNTCWDVKVRGMEVRICTWTS